MCHPQFDNVFYDVSFYKHTGCTVFVHKHGILLNFATGYNQQFHVVQSNYKGMQIYRFLNIILHFSNLAVCYFSVQIYFSYFQCVFEMAHVSQKVYVEYVFFYCCFFVFPSNYNIQHKKYRQWHHLYFLEIQIKLIRMLTPVIGSVPFRRAFSK